MKQSFFRKALAIAMSLAMVATMIPAVSFADVQGAQETTGSWTDCTLSKDGTSIEGSNYDISWFNFNTYTTKQNVYTIESAEELAGLAAITNGTAVYEKDYTDKSTGKACTRVVKIRKYSFDGKVIRLGADIDLSAYEWVPIAGFQGEFDGNGHTITGMTINTPVVHSIHAGDSADSLAVLGLGTALADLGYADLDTIDFYCAGLFASASAAEICDLTVDGAISIAADDMDAAAYAEYQKALKEAVEKGESEDSVATPYSDTLYSRPIVSGGIVAYATDDALISGCTSNVDISVTGPTWKAVEIEGEGDNEYAFTQYPTIAITGGIAGTTNLEFSLSERIAPLVVAGLGFIIDLAGNLNIDLDSETGVLGGELTAEDIADAAAEALDNLEILDSETVIKNCVNNGDIILESEYYGEDTVEKMSSDDFLNTFFGVTGGITAVTPNGDLYNCVNNGNIYSKNGSNIQGGIEALAVDAHTEKCVNNGVITAEKGSKEVGSLAAIQGGIAAVMLNDQSVLAAIKEIYPKLDLSILESLDSIVDFDSNKQLDSEESPEASEYTIVNCRNNGDINGEAYYGIISGGIAGCMFYDNIYNSANTGDVSVFAGDSENATAINPAALAFAGGIEGFATVSEVANCYSTGIMDAKAECAKRVINKTSEGKGYPFTMAVAREWGIAPSLYDMAEIVYEILPKDENGAITYCTFDSVSAAEPWAISYKFMDIDNIGTADDDAVESIIIPDTTQFAMYLALDPGEAFDWAGTSKEEGKEAETSYGGVFSTTAEYDSEHVYGYTYDHNYVIDDYEFTNCNLGNLDLLWMVTMPTDSSKTMTTFNGKNETANDIETIYIESEIYKAGDDAYSQAYAKALEESTAETEQDKVNEASEAAAAARDLAKASKETAIKATRQKISFEGIDLVDSADDLMILLDRFISYGLSLASDEENGGVISEDFFDLDDFDNVVRNSYYEGEDSNVYVNYDVKTVDNGEYMTNIETPYAKVSSLVETLNEYVAGNTENAFRENVTPLTWGKGLDAKDGTATPEFEKNLSKVLLAKAVYSSKTGKIKISWNKIQGATKYVVYGGKCSSKNVKKIATVKGTSVKVKNFKKRTAYKYYVVAYDYNGKICKSKPVHMLSNGLNKAKTKANCKSITAKNDEVTMEIGATKKLTAKVKICKGKAALKHVKAVRYNSSNKTVATVNGEGVVTAKSKGACYIYMRAENGKYCKTLVIVQ